VRTGIDPPQASSNPPPFKYRGRRRGTAEGRGSGGVADNARHVITKRSASRQNRCASHRRRRHASRCPHHGRQRRRHHDRRAAKAEVGISRLAGRPFDRGVGPNFRFPLAHRVQTIGEVERGARTVRAVNDEDRLRRQLGAGIELRVRGFGPGFDAADVVFYGSLIAGRRRLTSSPRGEG
jgi:hypothetical protein